MKALKFFLISLFLIMIFSLFSSYCYAVITTPFTTVATAPMLTFAPEITSLIPVPTMGFIPIIAAPIGVVPFWPTALFSLTVPAARVKDAVILAPMFAPTPIVTPITPITPTITPTAPTPSLVPTTPAPLVIPLGWPTTLFGPPLPVTGALWPAPATAPLI